jgi:hypothetical protein
MGIVAITISTAAAALAVTAGVVGYEEYQDLATRTAVMAELTQAGTLAYGHYAQTQDVQASLDLALQELAWSGSSLGAPSLEPGAIRYTWEGGCMLLDSEVHEQWGARFVVVDCV